MSFDPEFGRPLNPLEQKGFLDICAGLVDDPALLVDAMPPAAYVALEWGVPLDTEDTQILTDMERMLSGPKGINLGQVLWGTLTAVRAERVLSSEAVYAKQQQVPTNTTETVKLNVIDYEKGFKPKEFRVVKGSELVQGAKLQLRQAKETIESGSESIKSEAKKIGWDGEKDPAIAEDVSSVTAIKNVAQTALEVLKNETAVDDLKTAAITAHHIVSQATSTRWMLLAAHAAIIVKKRK